MTDTPHLTDDDLAAAEAAYDAHQEYEAAETIGVPEPHRPTYVPWTPASNREAEWAMAQVRAYTREIEGLEADRDEWLSRINAAHDAAVRPIDRRLAFFTDALVRYALDWHDADPKAHITLRLPSGDVSTRTPKEPTVHLADNAAVMAWLRSLPSEVVASAKAVREPKDPEPLVSGVRQLVSVVEKEGRLLAIDPMSGEVIEGLEVRPAGETTATVRPHC